MVSRDFPHNWDHAMGVFNTRGIELFLKWRNGCYSAKTWWLHDPHDGWSATHPITFLYMYQEKKSIYSKPRKIETWATCFFRMGLCSSCFFCISGDSYTLNSGLVIGAQWNWNTAASRCLPLWVAWNGEIHAGQHGGIVKLEDPQIFEYIFFKYMLHL